MLSNYLLSFIKDEHGSDDDQVIFQEDNAPTHSANHTKDWFFLNIIAVVYWTAKSPDLNVTDNAWTWLVKYFYKD